MSEQMIELDETYLPQMAELYKQAFGGEPWKDDWSDNEQLMAYVREISGNYNALNYGLLMDGKRDGNWGCLIVVWLTGAITGLQDYTPNYAPSLRRARFSHFLLLYINIYIYN